MKRSNVYKLQKVKFNSTIIGIMLNKTSDRKVSTKPVTLRKKKRFGIFTKSEE